MNDMRGHNAVKGKQGFQPVTKNEPSTVAVADPTGLIADRRGNIVDPNACRYCTFMEGYHPMVWAEEVGYHTYTAPDDALRLARMKARRVARV